MALSGIVTLLVLPAILTVAEKKLFGAAKAPQSVGCNCVFCVILAVAAVVLAVINVHQFNLLGWTTLAWMSAIAIPVLALACGMLSRRQACRRIEVEAKK